MSDSHKVMSTHCPDPFQNLGPMTVISILIFIIVDINTRYSYVVTSSLLIHNAVAYLDQNLI